MSKKLKITALISGILIILIVLGTCLVLSIPYIPKSLKHEIPLKGIERVTYSKEFPKALPNEPDPNRHELSAKEITQLKKEIKSNKCSRRTSLMKHTNVWHYNIYYKNGKVIQFGFAGIRKFDKNSKQISYNQYEYKGSFNTSSPTIQY